MVITILYIFVNFFVKNIFFTNKGTHFFAFYCFTVILNAVKYKMKKSHMGLLVQHNVVCLNIYLATDLR